MRIRALAAFSVLIALPLAACGGSSGTASPPTSLPKFGPTTTAHVAEPVSTKPSKSAQMICSAEAKKEIYEQATGVQVTSISTPTWKDHVYSCDFVYPGGAKFTMAVKELADAPQTTVYFDSLATKLHKTRSLVIGQGAFGVADGSVVVRKDFKVLLVDVTKLPATFGLPSAPRADVALNVAATIMSCWTGA
ncbi:MAG TPA: hypothetical protein VGP92_06460 [Acidimicrobiia bacterium]|nr:hypothetical protein [Acidimicrobiia bacterium]